MIQSKQWSIIMPESTINALIDGVCIVLWTFGVFVYGYMLGAAHTAQAHQDAEGGSDE